MFFSSFTLGVGRVCFFGLPAVYAHIQMSTRILVLEVCIVNRQYWDQQEIHPHD